LIEESERMPPTIPFWFKQRQCKAEPAGNDLVKVSGPNLGEAFLYVRPDKDHWAAGVRLTAEGADVAVTDPDLPTSKAAWDAAFELYRRYVII